MKYLLLFFLLFFSFESIHCQHWSKEDSLRLSRLLRGPGEIRINQKALQELKKNSGFQGSPLESTEKSYLRPDETLPSVYPDTTAQDLNAILTLKPYKPNTPFDYDPIYRVKFKVTKDTWRNDPLYSIKTMQTIYSNWAKTPFDAGDRQSVEQIEASGLRYNPFAGFANGMSVGSWVVMGKPTGIDLMTIFEKKFWNRGARKRAEKTLEILKIYPTYISPLDSLHWKKK